MGLSMYERQVLAGIEHGLRREDPRFAAELDQLAPAEVPPPRRRRRRVAWTRRKRVILAMVGMVAAFALAILVVSTTAAPSGSAGSDVQRSVEPCRGPDGRHLPGEACIQEPADQPANNAPG